MKQHPETEELLRYLDGELPVSRVSQIRKHLESCWQCRSELTGMQNAIAECVRYGNEILPTGSALPPKPWADIYRSFADIDATNQPPLFSRMPAVRRWAIAAVVLLTIAVLFLRFRETPSVQAAELLRRAATAEASHPTRPHRVQIRTRMRRLTRTTGVEQRKASNQADAAELNSVQALFQSAHYDWDDPLSVKSYQTWHDQLPQKEDRVSQEPGVFIIHTSTDASDLMVASLKLDSKDLRPIEQRFEFRNREWVEISELEPEPTLPPAAVLHERPAAVTNPPSIAALPSATISSELEVLAALHRIGADLGEPIEVKREGGQVVLTGIGVPPRRQAEIHEAVDSIGNVTLRFTNATAPPALAPEAQATDSPANPDILQLQAEIANRMGGRVQFDEMAAQALDLSEGILSRAYALHRLAGRFTPEVEAQLSPAERQSLRTILKDHAAVLRRQNAELNRIVQPVISKTRNPEPPVPQSAWQTASDQLLESSRRVEMLLAVMSGSASGRDAGKDLPSQLQAGLANLRVSLAACDRSDE